MSNTSRWKDLENQVAKALGGKRRFRTTESYGLSVPDILFPKKVRKMFPRVKQVVVECKKRAKQPIPSFFVQAKLLYGMDGKHVILATKVPLTKQSRKSWKNRKRKLAKKLGLKTKSQIAKLKLHDFASTLVTVELSFFQELWNAWLKEGNNGYKEKIRRFPRPN